MVRPGAFWAFIFPLEAIPVAVRAALPFTCFVDIIRGLLVKQAQFGDLMYAYAALLGFGVIFVSGSIMKFRQTL